MQSIIMRFFLFALVCFFNEAIVKKLSFHKTIAETISRLIKDKSVMAIYYVAVERKSRGK